MVRGVEGTPIDRFDEVFMSIRSLVDKYSMLVAFDATVEGGKEFRRGCENISWLTCNPQFSGSRLHFIYNGDSHEGAIMDVLIV